MKTLVRPAANRSRAAAQKSASLHAWHQVPTAEIPRLLDTHLREGLSSAEAKRRLAQFGPNHITLPRGTPRWLLFLRQFNQPLVYILLVSSAITAWLGEWVDSSVIFGVVFANAVVSFFQEFKAGKAIDALSRLLTHQAAVRRDGFRQLINAEQLVPGDVVILRPGDRVPADLRLFEVKDLQIDESTLTGESLPVSKSPEPLALETLLADRKNIAYAGTLVTAGHGEGVVWATGDLTETGHIARLISKAADLSTPLTRKIAHFSRRLLWIILSLAALTFAIGVWRGGEAVSMFVAAVALAVGAIPEGLPSAVTIVLAIGVNRMARRRAIIRNLPAVETLGSTTVICSDKTGTLTENQMTVREIFAGGKLYEVTGGGHAPDGAIRWNGRPIDLREERALAECLRAGLLCNDAQVVRKNGTIQIQGDPTEAALIIAAEKGGLRREAARNEMPRLDHIPFASEHMYRATLHQAKGYRVIYKIGALERILERCANELDSDGRIVPLNNARIHAMAEAMAAKGLRVLAFVRRHAAPDHERLEHKHVARELTFLGLQGMLDPPRADAAAAVRTCQQAGIAVKMITGDHLMTARRIAEQIGLARSGQAGIPALTGRDLDRIPDEELPEAADRTTVFARVAPEQKLRLVRALQARGHIVAMTGDGVNDAPALKQADIGIAMGLSGTDAARGAADMILVDDNFATIVAAVEEGRAVFANLTKFIVWTLPTNAGEAIILLVAILCGLVIPALPVQLLWVNLSTAIFLGLMLVFEAKEPNLMNRPPRDPRRPLLTHALIMRTGLVSLIILLGSYWLFFWELNVAGQSLAAARTAAVNVVVFVEMGYLFTCRSLSSSLLVINPFSNRWAIAGSACMAAAQLLFTYSEVMNQLFHSAPIPVESWLRIAAIAAAAVIAVEIEKWVRFHGDPGRRLIPD